MALRSLNSFVPDRNKKVLKKSRAFPSMPPSSPHTNDENVDLLGSPNRLPFPRSNSPVAPSCKPSLPPPPVDAHCLPPEDSCAEIEYILSENLSDLQDFEARLQTLLERLESKDWLKLCEAINNTRQLSIYHASSLLPILDKVIPLLIKALKNPRSAVCKTAIMASADLFKAFPNDIVTVLEQLLLQLLLKASQDKKFVCEEAERSLQTMTSSLSPNSLLVWLQPYVTHKNPRVRAKAASCVYRSVTKLGSEGIREYGIQSLLQMAASQLTDQLPEARESARKLVSELYAAYPSSDASPDQQNWNDFCNTQLSAHVAQAILRLTAPDS